MKMTVQKKAAKANPVQIKVDDVINRGGKTTNEAMLKSRQDSETRFTLRIPEELIEKIDIEREGRVGNVSRNQWILEAIDKKLNQ